MNCANAARTSAGEERVECQTAAEMLILAAQGQRPVMFAAIAMRKALNADKPAPTAATAQALAKIPDGALIIVPTWGSL